MILHAYARIEAYCMTYVALEKQGLQNFGAIEFGSVRIDCGVEFGRDSGLKRCVEEQDAGVDEIRLAFEKAGTHGRHHTVRAEQKEAGSSQRDRFVVQEIAAPGRKRVVEQAAIGKRGVAQES